MNQSSNVFSCFLDALKKTNQQHLFEVIVVDSSEGTKDVTIASVTFVDLSNISDRVKCWTSTNGIIVGDPIILSDR